MGLKMDGKSSMVYCLIGDGEMQEGQIWEAAMSAPKFELSNLCVILDNNGGQIDGPVSKVMPIEPIADKWRAFDWHVIEIDGHDMDSDRREPTTKPASSMSPARRSLSSFWPTP